ncbi:hypothetical protein K438DRAFT_1778536 [Mycena galopus ATCC 62051]|nr:hypothetical protein K438DRAFT_1778536 [Mycena galopus ATCC 62051]
MHSQHIHWWTLSSFPTPSGLFNVFRAPRPTAESSSTASSAHGAITGIAQVMVATAICSPSANAPSPSPGASTPTSKIAAPATLALFRSIVTNVSPTSAPSVGPGQSHHHANHGTGWFPPPQSENEEPAGSASVRHKPGRLQKTAPSAPWQDVMADTSTPALTMTEAPAPQLESEELARSAVPKSNPGRPRKTAIEGPEVPRPPPQDVVATSTPAPTLMGAAACAHSSRGGAAAEHHHRDAHMLKGDRHGEGEGGGREEAPCRVVLQSHGQCGPCGGDAFKEHIGESCQLQLHHPIGEEDARQDDRAKAMDPDIVQEAQDAELLARLRKRKSQAPQMGPSSVGLLNQIWFLPSMVIVLSYQLYCTRNLCVELFKLTNKLQKIESRAGKYAKAGGRRRARGRRGVGGGGQGAKCRHMLRDAKGRGGE